jgi:hypothetical protein
MRRSTAARSVRATSRGDRSFAPIAPDREANIFASFLLNGASPPLRSNNLHAKYGFIRQLGILTKKLDFSF